MTFKESLKVFRWDRLSHYQWASWFATAGAIIAICAARYGFHAGLPDAALAGAVTGVVVAVTAGVFGEKADAKANTEAGAEAPRREVSSKDVVASALGALPVSAPLLVVALIGFAAS